MLHICCKESGPDQPPCPILPPAHLSSNKFSHLVVTVFLVSWNQILIVLPESNRAVCWTSKLEGSLWMVEPARLFIWAGCIHLSVIDGLSSGLGVWHQSPGGFFIGAGCIHLRFGELRNPPSICMPSASASLLTSTVRSAVLLGTQM